MRRLTRDIKFDAEKFPYSKAFMIFQVCVVAHEKAMEFMSVYVSVSMDAFCCRNLS